MLRRMVFSAAMIGAALLVPISSANAVPPGGNGTQTSLTYYNNAQHSQVVGAQGYDCSGNPWHWGTTSPYSVFATSSCLPS